MAGDGSLLLGLCAHGQPPTSHRALLCFEGARGSLAALVQTRVSLILLLVKRTLCFYVTCYLFLFTNTNACECYDFDKGKFSVFPACQV